MAADHVRSVRFRRRAFDRFAIACAGHSLCPTITSQSRRRAPDICRSGAIGRRAELKPPNTLRVRLPPSAFTAGIEQGRLDGLISHNQQVRLLPPLPSSLNLMRGWARQFFWPRITNLTFTFGNYGGRLKFQQMVIKFPMMVWA